jgi:hypothetical protein
MRIAPITSTINSAGGRVGAHVLEPNRVRPVDPPGRVHEHVDTAIRRVRLGDKPFHRRLIRDIKFGGASCTSGGRDIGCHRFGLFL